MEYDSERVIHIGELERRGESVRFGIKEKDRARHIYVIGQTGTGKSTLLEIMAVQDMRNREGLIFIDPHGQSVEKLLGYIEEQNLDKVIYLAPHLQDRPIGLNVMEDVGYDHRHLVVSSLMASFERLWGAASWSDRMAYILQNTLLALIEYPGTTLLDVGRMYANKEFRDKVVENVKDPQVKKYWLDEFANYTDRYTQEATPAIQNKLGQFTANPLMRNIVGQPKSAFSFRQVMDEGKILLINLSKGLIGEGNARMLGVLFTTKIYLDALSRSDLTNQELDAAAPCNFYVDEFQSFANSTFAGILSEARKYKLNLVLAHQYIGQLYSDDAGDGNAIRDAVFGNVGTFISFRVGPVDAEIISKQFAPHISEEDLVALPRRHMYMTLNIDGAGSPPFSARTFDMPEPPPISLEEKIIEQSLNRYGVERSSVEDTVRKNLEEDWKTADARKGGVKGGFNAGGKRSIVGQVRRSAAAGLRNDNAGSLGSAIKKVFREGVKQDAKKNGDRKKAKKENSAVSVSPMKNAVVLGSGNTKKVVEGHPRVDSTQSVGTPEKRETARENKGRRDSRDTERRKNDFGGKKKKKQKQKQKQNTVQRDRGGGDGEVPGKDDKNRSLEKRGGSDKKGGARDKKKKPYMSLGESIQMVQSAGVEKKFRSPKKKQKTPPVPVGQEEGWVSLGSLSDTPSGDSDTGETNS